MSDEEQKPETKTKSVAPATIQGGGVVSTGTEGGIAGAAPTPDPEELKKVQDANPDWKDHFPQAAAQEGAERRDYEKTADLRRAEAEKKAAQEEANREKLNDDPHPTGDSVDPNAKQPELEKHGGDEPKP